MMETYRRLLNEYLQQPQGSCDSDLSDKLELTERAILDESPFRKGLIEQLNYRLESYELREAPGLSEQFEVIAEQDWPEAIADTDCGSLKPFDWYTYRQRYGSCASASLTDEIVLRRKLKLCPDIKLNPLFVYRHVNGGVDGGSSLAANLDHMMNVGVCSEDVWSSSNGWRARPPEEAYADAKRHRLLKAARIRNKTEFGSALIYGLPVYFGYPGHAITGGEPLDRTRFWYKNQWGKDWGEDGWGTLSYNSIQWSYGAWATLSVTTPDDEV